MGRTDEALASITEAIEHTRDDPATTGYCLVKRAGLARHMNDGKAALAFASEALRQYARAGRQSAELTTEVLGEIAYAHTLIGNSDLAQQFHAQAMRVLESRGRQQSHYALSLLNNWGAATLAGGNPRLALEYFEQAIALAQRRSPTGDPPFQLLDGKSAMLQILARYDAARAANEELWRIVSRGSEPVAYLCALSRKAQLEHRLGRLNEAQNFLDEANTLITKHKLPAYNPAVLRTRITQALVWAAQHRTSDAMASFTQLLEDFGRLNCCVETRVNLLLSRAELAASGGHLAEALVDATAALEIAQRLQGRLPFSFYTGRAYLVLGQIHRARHQLQEAKRAYDHAVQNLSPALGEQHPDTLQALHAAQEFVPVKK
jgi:tetratricopeptide (TPR) repeat protein